PRLAPYAATSRSSRAQGSPGGANGWRIKKIQIHTNDAGEVVAAGVAACRDLHDRVLNCGRRSRLPLRRRSGRRLRLPQLSTLSCRSRQAATPAATTSPASFVWIWIFFILQPLAPPGDPCAREDREVAA